MTTGTALLTAGANPLVPGAWENVAAAVGAAVVALLVAATVSLLRTGGQDPVLRLLWLLVILAFPVVGSALWFALGRRDPRLRNSPPA
jgi:hypothetical protein